MYIGFTNRKFTVYSANRVKYITHFSYLFLHPKLQNVKIFPAETPSGKRKT